MMQSVTPVILSGGQGTRLWPLSRPETPKQLQSLVGSQSLLQATAARIEHLGDHTIVVANLDHLDEIARQLPKGRPRLLIGEPAPRNTAPAIAAAALTLDQDEVMVVLPADHHFGNEARLRSAIGVAVEAAAEGYLVTFGIVPTRAETGYGYIVPGDTLGEARRIERFVEKPEPDIAMRLSTEGALWNSGMFAFPVGLLLAELGLHRPGVVEAARASLPAGIPASGRLELSAAFAGAESVSIDVAVMQSTKRGLVVPLDAGWSDVGSWESMWELGDHDAQGNVRSGKVLDMGTSRSYLHSTGPLLAAIDVEDLIVVATGDAVLVARRDSAQDVKTLVHRIEAEQLEGLSGGAAGPSADDSESLQ